MRTAVGRLAVIGAVILAACAPERQSTVPPTQHSPAGVAGLATTTPSSPPTPAAAPQLMTTIGAVASPSGFLAFAVLDNGSAQEATHVRIEITALDASGRVLMRRQGSIERIPSQHRGALALAFPVVKTLPSRFTGSVLGVQWSSGLPGQAVEIIDSSFVENARTPGVRVGLRRDGAGTAHVILTAVCWDAAGAIRGGGSQALTIGPGSGTDVFVPVAISTVPSRCDAYGATS